MEKNIIDNKEIILFRTISIKDKYNFFEYLGIMLDGGVSLTESLSSVESKITSLYFKGKIKELITYISSGDSISKAMRNLPDIFSKSEISIIEAGEGSGTVVDSFMKISDDLKRIDDLKKKIKGALTYPLIIFLFLFLALFIVLKFVIPELENLFTSSSIELPVSTQLLIGLSDFVVNNSSLLFLSFFSLVVFTYGYSNTVSGRKSIEHFVLDLPLIGIVYKNYILSNIASTLGTLIGSGVPVLKALKLVGRSTNNSIYESLFDEVVVLVSGGEQIVYSMSKVDLDKVYFPADFLQMLSVGERTANLDKISKKLSNQYLKEVDYSLLNLTKWIEPIAILFAAIFVTWFAYAIIGAILKVTESVG